MSFVLGLVGAGIHASLTPALHEREGREQGLALAYGLIDAEVERFGSVTFPTCWPGRPGSGTTVSTSPTRSSRQSSRCSTTSPTTRPTWVRSTRS